MTETEVEARAGKRLKAEAVRRAVRWPKECPTCWSPIGDRCRTLKGVVTMEHMGRAHLRGEKRDYERYPFGCNACKRGVGEHCVSLYTGARSQPHRIRRLR